MTQDYRSLPPNLPAPVDDGAADHLPGMEVPAVRLRSTLGGEVDLAQAALRMMEVNMDAEVVAADDVRFDEDGAGGDDGAST